MPRSRIARAALAVATVLIVIACGTPVGASQPAGAGQPGAGKVTLLDLSGTGTKNSSPFTTTSAWTLAYNYDCAKFGAQGNFQVFIEDDAGAPVGVAVNELAAKGSSSTAQYEQGHLHLTMNSECDWHVTATQP
jgi:hypothetical protein